MTQRMLKRPLGTMIVPLILLAISACGGGVPFQGMTADEIYNEGLEKLRNEKWDDAIRAFERAVLTPGLARAPEARLYLGHANFAKKRFIQAAAEYQRVLDRFGGDTIAGYAGLGVCRSNAGLAMIPQRDQSFTRQARSSCTQVARDYAGTLLALEAAEIRTEMYNRLAESDYLVGVHYFKRNGFDSANEYFEEVINQYPDSKWAPWAMYKMIQSFEKIGYGSDATDLTVRLIREYPDSEPAKLVSPEGDSGAGDAG